MIMGRVNDVGGMEGFPSIEPESDLKAFHADWEAHLFGLHRVLVQRGTYNLDQFRDAIERMPPSDYLSTSYYERWLHAITTLLVERDIIDVSDLAGDADG